MDSHRNDWLASGRPLQTFGLSKAADRALALLPPPPPVAGSSAGLLSSRPTAEPGFCQQRQRRPPSPPRAAFRPPLLARKGPGGLIRTAGARQEAAAAQPRPGHRCPASSTAPDAVFSRPAAPTTTQGQLAPPPGWTSLKPRRGHSGHAHAFLVRLASLACRGNSAAAALKTPQCWERSRFSTHLIFRRVPTVSCPPPRCPKSPDVGPAPWVHGGQLVWQPLPRLRPGSRASSAAAPPWRPGGWLRVLRAVFPSHQKQTMVPFPPLPPPRQAGSGVHFLTLV